MPVCLIYSYACCRLWIRGRAREERLVDTCPRSYSSPFVARVLYRRKTYVCSKLAYLWTTKVELGLGLGSAEIHGLGSTPQSVDRQPHSHCSPHAHSLTHSLSPQKKNSRDRVPRPRFQNSSDILISSAASIRPTGLDFSPPGPGPRPWSAQGGYLNYAHTLYKRKTNPRERKR